MVASFKLSYFNLISITATSAVGSATFGQGTGSIILDDVSCIGTESSIVECPHGGLNIHNCAHSEDAGVHCKGTCRIYCCVCAGHSLSS